MSALALTVDFDAGPRRGVTLMVGTMVAFAATALVLMAVGKVDVSVAARGAVIAPSHVQEVQSLEGGIVRQLLVRPGQTVIKGQPLVRLDSVQYDADLGESRQSMLAVDAARIRIDALLNGREPQFGVLETQAPEIVREERRLWQDAMRAYQATLASGAEGVQRHAGELAEARTRIVALEATVKVAQESFAIEERLFKEGAGSRADYLAAQSHLLQQQGELDSLRSSLPRLEASLAEGRAQAAEATSRARAQWGQQRTELEAKAATLAPTVQGRADKVARRELVAPMDGIVNRVLVPTQGGVAAPGAGILEIVPTHDGLVVNTRVKPNDIGFIHVGQQAAVRVSTFDYAIYGRLEGVVERVGADTLLDENKQPYFEVQIRTARDHLEHDGQRLAITSGMPIEASILTGKRTILQYLLKPLLKTLHASLQER